MLVLTVVGFCWANRVDRAHRTLLIQHLLKANCTRKVRATLLCAHLTQVIAHEDVLRSDLLREVSAGLLSDDAELLVTIAE